MHLIIGLGNPGIRYAETRHNVGLAVVAHAASQWGIPLVSSSIGQVGRGSLNHSPVLLALPSTWMNLSGEAVEPLIQQYDVPLDHVIVVHDDLDLPLGRLRIKFGGGTGGHNGLRSIVFTVNSENFYRLKVGIGRPEPGQDPADFVLTPFPENQKRIMEDTISRAVDALRCLVVDGPAVAMNRFNRRIEEER